MEEERRKEQLERETRLGHGRKAKAEKLKELFRMNHKEKKFVNTIHKYGMSYQRRKERDWQRKRTR